jgi:hypothetical protein
MYFLCTHADAPGFGYDEYFARAIATIVAYNFGFAGFFISPPRIA